MIAQTQDYLACHGIPTAVPQHHSPEEFEEEPEAVEDALFSYQPAPVCGQCEHLAQPQYLVTRLGHSHGFCPLLETVRHISDKPYRLYREDCPF